MICLGHPKDVERALDIIQKRYPDVDVNTSATQAATLTLSANTMQVLIHIYIVKIM